MDMLIDRSTTLLYSTLETMKTSVVQVANVGPADYNYDESISTLRYANRAKNIKNKARINEDPKDALLRQYQNEIDRLKKLLEEGGNLGGEEVVCGFKSTIMLIAHPHVRTVLVTVSDRKPVINNSCCQFQRFSSWLYACQVLDNLSSLLAT